MKFGDLILESIILLLELNKKVLFVLSRFFSGNFVAFLECHFLKLLLVNWDIPSDALLLESIVDNTALGRLLNLTAFLADRLDAGKIGRMS